MWRALNEDQWATARDNTGWTGEGVTTLGSSVARLEADAGSPGNDAGVLENIQQISNLIISSARHLRRDR